MDDPNVFQLPESHGEIGNVKFDTLLSLLLAWHGAYLSAAFVRVSCQATLQRGNVRLTSNDDLM